MINGAVISLRWVVLAFGLALPACRSPPPGGAPSQNAHRVDAAADAYTVAGTSFDASGDAGRVAVSAGAGRATATVFGCVLDMGEGRKGSRTSIGPDGVVRIVHQQTRCSLAADCIREKGRTSPGDALVSIDCRGRHCVCGFESFTPNDRRIKFSFETEDPCDETRLKSLLFEHCLDEGRKRTRPGRR